MAIRRPAGTFNEKYAEDMAIVRTKTQWAMLVGFLVFLFAVPMFANERWLALISTIAVTVIAVHGLNVTTGYCGQISLGQAAFMAVGAYCSGLLSGMFGLPFWLCLICAGLAAGLVGVVFGLPSVRVKGFYLALATLAAHFIIMYVIVIPYPEVTGGSNMLSVPAATLGSIAFTSEKSCYYLIMVVAVLVTIFVKNLARMNVGRAFVAIRDNDLAAEAMGINVFRYKLLAFFVGCFLAGIAGSLWAHYCRVISPDDFTLMKAVWLVGMLIVGGLGSTLGAIMGVVFIQVLNELAMTAGPMLVKALPALGMNACAALVAMAFGVVVILFLVFEPRGLAHRWEILKSSYRLWPFSY